MEDNAYLKSLVGDYLASVSPNVAKKFKKESNAIPLPPGSPSLLEIVKEHQKNSPTKRKLSQSNGHTPAKKAKKVKYFSEGLACINMCKLASIYFKSFALFSTVFNFKF